MYFLNLFIIWYLSLGAIYAAAAPEPTEKTKTNHTPKPVPELQQAYAPDNWEIKTRKKDLQSFIETVKLTAGLSVEEFNSFTAILEPLLEKPLEITYAGVTLHIFENLLTVQDKLTAALAEFKIKIRATELVVKWTS